MRLLARYAALFLFFALPQYAAVARVQHTSNSATATNTGTTTISVSFASTTAANTIVVAGIADSENILVPNLTWTGVSDTANGTYTKIFLSQPGGVNSTGAISLYYFKNIAGGATTITLSFYYNGFNGQFPLGYFIAAAEYSGMSTSPSIPAGGSGFARADDDNSSPIAFSITNSLSAAITFSVSDPTPSTYKAYGMGDLHNSSGGGIDYYISCGLSFATNRSPTLTGGSWILIESALAGVGHSPNFYFWDMGSPIPPLAYHQRIHIIKRGGS